MATASPFCMKIDAIITFLARIWRAASNFIVLAILARVLTKNGLDEYLYCASIFVTASYLVPLGLGVGVIKNSNIGALGVFEAIKKSNIMHFFSIQFFCIVYVLVYGFLAKPIDSFSIVLCVFNGGLIGVINSYSDYFRALGLYKEASFYCGTVPSIVTLVTAVAIFYNKISNINGILIFSIIGQASSLFFAVYILYKYKVIKNNSESLHVGYKKIISGGVSSMAASVVGIFVPSIAIAVAVEKFGASSATELGVAHRILFFVTLPMWISNTIMPKRIIDALSGKSDKGKDFFSKVILVNFCMSSLMMVALFFTSDFLVEIISGRTDLHGASSLLRDLSVGYFLYGVFGAYMSAAAVVVGARYMMYSSIISMLFFFVSLELLIFLGVNGVYSSGYAQVAAMIMHVVICYGMTMRSIAGTIMPSLGYVIASGAACRK